MKPQLFRVLPLLALAMATWLPGAPASADPVTDKLKDTLKARLGDDVDIREIVKTPAAGHLRSRYRRPDRL